MEYTIRNNIPDPTAEHCIFQIVSWLVSQDNDLQRDGSRKIPTLDSSLPTNKRKKKNIIFAVAEHLERALFDALPNSIPRQHCQTHAASSAIAKIQTNVTRTAPVQPLRLCWQNFQQPRPIMWWWENSELERLLFSGDRRYLHFACNNERKSVIKCYLLWHMISLKSVD